MLTGLFGGGKRWRAAQGVRRLVCGGLAWWMATLAPARGQSTQVATHDPLGNLTTQTTSAAASAPAIIAGPSPSAAVAPAGAAVSFSVVAAGSPPLAFQWKFNGANIPTASNPSAGTATLQLPALTAGNFGSYQVVVTNGAGSVASAAVSLQLDSVGSGLPDSWKVQYFGANWAANPSAGANADPDGDGVTNLQEFLDGTDPTSAASRFYRLTVSGPVTVTPARDRYAPGTVVTLTARPEGDITFNGWAGDVTSAANPLTLTMNRDYAVAAQMGGPYQLDQPAVPPTFTQRGNATVYAQVTLADNSVVIGGSFTAVDGVARLNLARINADGTLNPAFAPRTDGAVSALAVQADGNILVGGAFGYIGGVFSPGLARVSPTGVVDPAFAAQVSAFNYNSLATNYVANLIYGVAVRASDGAILAGGVATRSSNCFSIVLAADGSQNTTFNNLAAQIGGAYSRVQAVGWEPNGAAVFGGFFKPGAATTYSALARVTAAGALDTAFTPTFGTFNPTVYALAVFPNGDLLVGGDFSQVDGVDRGGVARLRTADGSLDPAVNVGDGAAGRVNAVGIVSATGKLLIGGTFYSVNDVDQHQITRLNADGSLDGSFNAGNANTTSVSVYTVAAVTGGPAAGAVLAGGRFDRYDGAAGNVDLVRLKGADGTVDAAFPALVTSLYGVRCLAAQPDGKVLVGGVFDFATTTPHANLARLNSDNTVDPTFLPDGGGPDGLVNVIVVQPDRKILIAGGFSSLDGLPTPVYGLARLNPDGSQDPGFLPPSNVSYGVNAMAVQPNGQILLGGSFTVTDPNDPDNPQNLFLIRLNLDGSLDTAYAPAFDGAVNAVVVQPDGKVLVGGQFTTADNNSGDAYGLLRLNADGTPDPTFTSPFLNGLVQLLALQPDGKLYAAGSLPVPGVYYPYSLLRLNADGSLDAASKLTDPNSGIGYFGSIKAMGLQPDGRLVYTGSGLQRLNADSSSDTYFAWNGSLQGTNNTASAAALALPPDGSIIVGATALLYFNGQPRLGYTRFAAVNPNLTGGSLSATAAGTGVNLTWTPGASAAPVTTVVLQASSDGMNFRALQPAAPQSDGTWTLPVASLPPGLTYFRAAIGNADVSAATSNIVGPFAAAPVVTSVLTATGTVGAPFAYTATATYPVTGFTASGLPAWAAYAFNPANGVLTLSGTPNALGVSTITLAPSNSAGSTSAILKLTIGQPYAAWAATNFTPAENQNPAISGPLGDATGAGIVNLIKYALSIPPKRPGVTGLPTVTTTTVNGLKYLSLTYTATPAATDVVETVEVSGGLSDWQSGPAATTEVSRTPTNADGTQTVVARDNVPMTETATRFIRLRVSQSPP